jgi:hypothetical protein
MFKPPTIEEVDAELADLESRLSEFNRLMARKQTLLDYKSVLARLSSNGSETAHKEKAPQGQGIETAEAAKQILAGVPHMSEKDLPHEAVKLGWESSGSEKRDVRRFYAAMHRQEDVFEKVQGMPGTWRLKK